MTNKSSSLFGIKSFINHDQNPNIISHYSTENLVVLHASKDIEEGEELLIDYCSDVTDQNERIKIL